MTVPATAERKPLAPVSVAAKFISGADRQSVLDGCAVLSITGEDGAETPYWCKAHMDGERCLGFRLTKLGTKDFYDLPRDLSGCDCADSIYRNDRPGGCKHQAALRQALPTLKRE